MDMLLFLIPDVGQSIQVFFFGLIFCLCIGIIFSIKKNAHSENWDINWHGTGEHNKLDDLDVEHGSLHDLSAAVATKSENLGDVMPGILLIIGLLGTFLGLGIVLNEASGALGSENLEDSMMQLSGMMDGLGTKFKASIWGIIGFLTLKIFITVYGHEERRFRWAAEEMKKDVDAHREYEQEKDNKMATMLQTCIDSLGGTLCETLTQDAKINHEILRDSKKVMSKSYLKQDEIISCFEKVTAQSKDELSKLLSTINLTAIEANQKQDEALEHLTKLNNENINNIDSFLSKINDTLIKNNQKQDVAIKISTVLDDKFDQLLKNSNNDIKLQNQLLSKYSKVENNISIANETSIEMKNLLENKHKEQKVFTRELRKQNELSDKILKATTESTKEMKAFSTSSKDSIESMSLSSTSMSEAAVKINEGAVNINKGAEKLTGTVDNFEAGVSDVMSSVKDSLGNAIENMSDSLKTSLTDTANQMKRATDNISSAVEQNSINMKNTMDDVQKSISKSVEIQTKSSIQFTTTSQTLNENVEGMTGLVDTLKDDIKSGLKAVSDSGSRMRSLDSRYKNSSDQTEELIASVSKHSDDIHAALKAIYDNGAIMINIDARYKNNSDQTEKLIGTVSKHSDDIKAALKAISDSGAIMISIDERYKNSLDQTEKLISVVSKHSDDQKLQKEKVNYIVSEISDKYEGFIDVQTKHSNILNEALLNQRKDLKDFHSDVLNKVST